MCLRLHMNWKIRTQTCRYLKLQIADYTVSQAERQMSSSKQEGWKPKLNKRLLSSLLCARHCAGCSPLLAHTALPFTL